MSTRRRSHREGDESSNEHDDGEGLTVFGQAIGDALPQAVAIAISPIPIVLVIAVLVSEGARSKGLAFAAGWLVGVILVAGAAFLLSNGADVAGDEAAADGADVLQIVFGLLFAVMAVRQWQKRPRPGEEPSTPAIFDAVDSMSVVKVLGFALAAAVANPKNLPLAISAGVAIAQADVSTGQGIGAVVVFGLVASSSVLVAVTAVVVLGDRTKQPLDDVKTWLLANNSTILIVLCTVLAAVMLGSGLGITG